MTLEDIPAGTHLVVDANILVYHFTGYSQQCRALLARGAAGDIHLYSPVHVCLEFLHRRMMLEAVETGLVAPGNVARKMAQKPAAIAQLHKSRTDFEQLPMLGLQLLPLGAATLTRLPRLSAQYGLLANDAALLAVMEEHQLLALATADRGLTGIPPFRTYAPSDLD